MARPRKGFCLARSTGPHGLGAAGPRWHISAARTYTDDQAHGRVGCAPAVCNETVNPAAPAARCRNCLGKSFMAVAFKCHSHGDGPRFGAAAKGTAYSVLIFRSLASR